MGLEQWAESGVDALVKFKFVALIITQLAIVEFRRMILGAVNRIFFFTYYFILISLDHCFLFFLPLYVDINQI